MTRARIDVSERDRAEIARLWRRHRGSRRIARVLGLSHWAVRRVLGELGLSRGRPSERPWSSEAPLELRPKADWDGPYTHDDHLQHTAGERGVTRLARELGRTEREVNARLSALGLRMEDLRMTLTLQQVVRLTGRDQSSIVSAIRTRSLRAHKSDGIWQVHPKDLRRWVLDGLERIDLDRLGDPDDPSDLGHARRELMGLLGKLWGVTDETERRAERRARAGGAEAPRALGPSSDATGATGPSREIGRAHV